MMHKSQFSAVVSAMGLLVLGGHALAAGTGGCGSFDWTLDVEQAWIASADREKLATGASLPAVPAKAIELKLDDVGSVKYPVTPSGKGKADDGKTFGGFVTFDTVAKPGTYQVTISAPGWIDVVQAGVTLRPLAHTGKKDCETIRKSVRFSVGNGPMVLEFSGVASKTVVFAVRAAE